MKGRKQPSRFVHLPGLIGAERRTRTRTTLRRLHFVGIDRLAALPNLKELTMAGTESVCHGQHHERRDDAIPVLASWPSLREVDLKGTAVTAQGLAALRKAKPNCRIYHGPWDPWEARAASFRNN